MELLLVSKAANDDDDDDDDDDDAKRNQKKKKDHYTFASANFLLGLDALGKFQMMANVRGRMDKILESLDRMTMVKKKLI